MVWTGDLRLQTAPQDWIRYVSVSSETGCHPAGAVTTAFFCFGQSFDPQRHPPRYQLQLMFISIMYTFFNL